MVWKTTGHIIHIHAVFFGNLHTLSLQGMQKISGFVTKSILIFITGFQHDVRKFFIFMLTVYLVAISSASIGFFYSSMANVVAIANVCTAMTSVFMIVSYFLPYSVVPHGNCAITWLRVETTEGAEITTT